MFDYLQKFNNLPRNLRDKVSSSEAIKTISILEESHKVDLAAVVMKVMTKVLSVDDLINFFISNFSLSKEASLSLKNDLINKVFFSVKDYLGIKDEVNNNVNVKNNINDFSSLVIKETGISLASEDLYLRLINIILTYQKGVRNKIDTKSSLMKDVKFGGLNLSEQEVDNIFLAISSIKSKDDEETDIKLKDGVEEGVEKVSSRDKLDKIIMSAEASSYNFNNIKPSFGNNQKVQLAEKKPLAMLKENKQAVLLTEANEVSKEDEKEVIVPENLPVEDDFKDDSALQEEIVTETVNKIEEALVTEETANEDEKISEVEKTKEKKEIKFEEKEFVPSQILNLNLKRSSIEPSKARIHDIKPVTKIISPIDELRLIDLVNFRRLGETPKLIVLKIFSKIKLLEKDGYDKMIEGVKAWRQSEVNHLYIKIGQEVIIRDSSYSEVINKRKEAKLPYLNIDEINAISQLNSKLSF